MEPRTPERAPRSVPPLTDPSTPAARMDPTFGESVDSLGTSPPRTPARRGTDGAPPQPQMLTPVQMMLRTRAPTGLEPLLAIRGENIEYSRRINELHTEICTSMHTASATLSDFNVTTEPQMIAVLTKLGSHTARVTRLHAALKRVYIRLRGLRARLVAAGVTVPGEEDPLEVQERAAAAELERRKEELWQQKQERLRLKREIEQEEAAAAAASAAAAATPETDASADVDAGAGAADAATRTADAAAPAAEIDSAATALVEEAPSAQPAALANSAEPAAPVSTGDAIMSG